MKDREYELGSRIARHLDRGAYEIDPVTQASLRQARVRALESLQIQPSWELVPAATPALRGGVLRHFNTRHLLPVAVLLAMISGMVYWQHAQHIDELVDIDAKLLAGDLPIDAYLDTGLDSWLKR
jgi:hypothetical protein